ncbi:MAG: response regulator [Deltaproteobacteria bacterium]|nr:response regulator [Deltaproteobacteria bacterium]
MNRQFHILVADRNRHVRELLRRELLVEGYSVQLAKDSEEVMAIIEGCRVPDLLILDPEIPNPSGISMLEMLSERIPPLPVVVHTLEADAGDSVSQNIVAAFIEKSGDTNKLKHLILQVLEEFYPHRFRQI